MNVPDKPGIYDGLSYEQYDAIKAMRRGVIDRGVAGKGTLMHMRHAMEHPETEPSAALLFGQALHAAVLEPDRFERTVILGPGRDVTNKETGETTYQFYGADTKTYAAFAAANHGKIIMAKGDRDRLIGMGAAIRNHPKAGALIRATTRAELTLVWDDASSGVRCKARADSFIGRGLGMVDLKSTTNASPEAFARSMYDYGYHIQAAMTIDAWKTLTGEDEPFSVVAVEKDAPYAAACYVFGEDTLAVGRQQYQEVLHAVAHAMRTGEWPGYPSDVMQLDAPEWVFKRFHSAA